MILDAAKLAVRFASMTVRRVRVRMYPLKSVEETMKMKATSVPAKAKNADAKNASKPTRNKTKSISLKEGSLVVVFEGLKKIEKGPHAGQVTVGATKIFIGTEQVGLLNSFSFESVSGEILPKVTFDFGLQGPYDLADAYQQSIERIKVSFPWAKWQSPIGGSPEPDVKVDVLDPGLLRPTTPKSGGGL